MSDNLPPGCSVNDIPGWLEYYTFIHDITCPNCQTHFDEMEVCIGSSDDIEVECDKCKKVWYEPFANHFPTE
jgi:predicted Zn finger-like uncharacterized protein